MPIELQSALIEICNSPYIFDALDYIHKTVKERLMDREVFLAKLSLFEGEKGEGKWSN